MAEEANSWIRRTKFSHTVCHRLDSSKFISVPFHLQSDSNPDWSLGWKPRSTVASSNQKAVHNDIQIQRNPITNKQRSVSPLPQTVLSDTFKEARSESRRFSTPHPRRKESEKRRMGKFFHKEPHDKKGSSSPAPSNSSPLRHVGSMKVSDKSKSRKESAWTKYFDHAGGRVNAVEAADEHTVELSQLFLGLRFAHGAHSRLYHGIYKEEAVAVKIIRVPDDDENGNLAARLEKQFDREVTLLSRLHHMNVIKFVAACRKPPVYCIITEYLSEGSLRAYLHKLDHKLLPLRKLIAIALEVARGMEYIHSQGVIHRDLKPENVLIDQDFHLKIADFGIACEETYCDFLADDPGTYRWMAPEMIKRKSYGKKVDVYSFGLILWEMIAGTIPYEDMNPIQAAFAVVNKKLRPVIPGDCPPAMRALIEQCWSSHPDKRPEFWQIVKVLEQFESSLNHDGTLNLVPNPTCQDHKKGLLHWIQKLGPVHPHSNTYTSPVPKPKFS
ncbi:serine/threonine-protein kinase HT1-like [Durio zibethinus]|uniref:non-specific serine/threonine protein kinase n=1 Tax=Durio zibethinus TaxID=66656 RepID=A0A6P5WIV1_DURZI|nr:serine/threonine-protein kinase HT1-like [Durio zibethinus]XP_022715868.1 serine/threonine-protein kinase HT1-like [Durio zibethinus]XP_022715869.1 serine/threonine-protein kinase HT1-like [Durio zibethinus]XP_022715870.1 serine/threonine-protein kinase HT1-like [Durio zibethinus]